MLGALLLLIADTTLEFGSAELNYFVEDWVADSTARTGRLTRK